MCESVKIITICDKEVSYMAKLNIRKSVLSDYMGVSATTIIDRMTNAQYDKTSKWADRMIENSNHECASDYKKAAVYYTK